MCYLQPLLIRHCQALVQTALYCGASLPYNPCLFIKSPKISESAETENVEHLPDLWKSGTFALSLLKLSAPES